jgi:hypothetical protein
MHLYWRQVIWIIGSICIFFVRVMQLLILIYSHENSIFSLLYSLQSMDSRSVLFRLNVHTCYSSCLTSQLHCIHPIPGVARPYSASVCIKPSKDTIVNTTFLIHTVAASLGMKRVHQAGTLNLYNAIKQSTCPTDFPHVLTGCDQNLRYVKYARLIWNEKASRVVYGCRKFLFTSLWSTCLVELIIWQPVPGRIW